MTKVHDFLSRNADVGADFRAFAVRHETLKEVWEHCPTWYWMLDLLDRCHYRNAEKLERYIDRQTGHIEDVSDTAIEATRLRHFNYKRGANQIQADAEAGNLSPSEARRRRFIWARTVAYEASDFIFRDTINRVRFNNACAPITDVDLELPLTDETEVGRSLLQQQADELREILGNPFQFAGVDDFSYGDIR